MSDTSRDVIESLNRLSRRDPTLNWINLGNKQLTDFELADCLLAHPDVVTRVYLDYNRLTDETGVKLARYLAASSTVQVLDLRNNQFGSVMYLALAAALRVNSSLQVLHLFDNQAVDRTNIDAVFVEALRLNPIRPAWSRWWLYSFGENEFERLKQAADELGVPSMLSQLDFVDDCRAETKIHTN